MIDEEVPARKEDIVNRKLDRTVVLQIDQPVTL
jgi:hypothetical protein